MHHTAWRLLGRLRVADGEQGQQAPANNTGANGQQAPQGQAQQGQQQPGAATPSAQNGGAASSTASNGSAGTPPANGQQAAGQQPAGQSQQGQSTQGQQADGQQPGQQQPAQPEPFSPAQQAYMQQLVSNAVAEGRNRERRDQRRQQQQQQRTQAEQDGDTEGLLNIERQARSEADTENTRLTGEVQRLNRENSVLRVAGRHQLDAVQQELLLNDVRITDEASAERIARTLAQYRQQQTPPNTDAGAGNRPAARHTQATNGGARAQGQAQGGQTGAQRQGGGDPAPNYSFNNPGEVAWPE